MSRNCMGERFELDGEMVYRCLYNGEIVHARMKDGMTCPACRREVAYIEDVKVLSDSEIVTRKRVLLVRRENGRENEWEIPKDCENPRSPSPGTGVTTDGVMEAVSLIQQACQSPSGIGSRDYQFSCIDAPVKGGARTVATQRVYSLNYHDYENDTAVHVTIVATQAIR